MTLSLSSEPQARSLYRPRITQKRNEPNSLRPQGLCLCDWREWVLIYVWERWEVKCLGVHVMGTHQQCDQQLPDLGLRKGPRVLRSTPREWRAGTTASSAKGGRPGTAAVPRRRLLASHYRYMLYNFGDEIRSILVLLSLLHLYCKCTVYRCTVVYTILYICTYNYIHCTSVPGA